MEINSNTLWYRQPASCWQQALPLGNGRMGAMVYGGEELERIDLSECTFVSGEALEHNSQPQAVEAYHAAKASLLAGNYAAADAHAQGMTGLKLNYGTNLPVGQLRLEFNHADKPEGYCRSLDLGSSISNVQFGCCGKAHEREAFLSHPDQVLVIRISGGQPFTVRFDGQDCPFTISAEGNDLLAEIKACEPIHSDGRTGVTMHLRLRVLARGGTVSAAGGCLKVQSSDEVVLLLAMNTDFKRENAFDRCQKQIDQASGRNYEQLLSRHKEDFGGLFNRCALNLGEGPGLPTDEWLAMVRNGVPSNALAALMFQYGRYLFLCSSREDSPLPAHLQGAWNDNIACRIGWTCDMHLDINTQMNYWPAYATGLYECALPLHRWIQETLLPSGRLTAHETYGLGGWVAHTVANAWGYTAPGWSTGWGLHSTGGVWISTHLWEHWLYTGDREFLAETAYPILRQAVEFFTDYLVEDKKTGYLLPIPSYSPENGFSFKGEHFALSEGAYCDILLIRELFDIFEGVCAEQDVDGELRCKARQMATKLPPFQVGKNGQLQEWLNDFEEAAPNHRHTSHLLSLFPFAQITPDGTPALASAARVTLRRRMNADMPWEDTGWARSLLLLYSARLWDGEAAFNHVLSMQRALTNDNLLVFHPPVAGAQSNVYELDGNTGLTAGIAEMLLQSQGGRLHLLPALPPEWKDGSVSGLCGRGGFVVGLQWEDGVLASASITSMQGKPCSVVYKGKTVVLGLQKGQTICLTAEYFC